VHTCATRNWAVAPIAPIAFDAVDVAGLQVAGLLLIEGVIGSYIIASWAARGVPVKVGGAERLRAGKILVSVPFLLEIGDDNVPFASACITGSAAWAPGFGDCTGNGALGVCAILSVLRHRTARGTKLSSDECASTSPRRLSGEVRVGTRLVARAEGIVAVIARASGKGSLAARARACAEILPIANDTGNGTFVVTAKSRRCTFVADSGVGASFVGDGGGTGLAAEFDDGGINDTGPRVLADRVRAVRVTALLVTIIIISPVADFAVNRAGLRVTRTFDLEDVFRVELDTSPGALGEARLVHVGDVNGEVHEAGATRFGATGAVDTNDFTFTRAVHIIARLLDDSHTARNASVLRSSVDRASLFVERNNVHAVGVLAPTVKGRVCAVSRRLSAVRVALCRAMAIVVIAQMLVLVEEGGVLDPECAGRVGLGSLGVRFVNDSSPFRIEVKGSSLAAVNLVNSQGAFAGAGCPIVRKCGHVAVLGAVVVVAFFVVPSSNPTSDANLELGGTGGFLAIAMAFGVGIQALLVALTTADFAAFGREFAVVVNTNGDVTVPHLEVFRVLCAIARELGTTFAAGTGWGGGMFAVEFKAHSKLSTFDRVRNLGHHVACTGELGNVDSTADPDGVTVGTGLQTAATFSTPLATLTLRLEADSFNQRFDIIK
jgi:hypothetical protein